MSCIDGYLKISQSSRHHHPLQTTTTLSNHTSRLSLLPKDSFTSKFSTSPHPYLTSTPHHPVPNIPRWYTSRTSHLDRNPVASDLRNKRVRRITDTHAGKAPTSPRTFAFSRHGALVKPRHALAPVDLECAARERERETRTVIAKAGRRPFSPRARARVCVSRFEMRCVYSVRIYRIITIASADDGRRTVVVYSAGARVSVGDSTWGWRDVYSLGGVVLLCVRVLYIWCARGNLFGELWAYARWENWIGKCGYGYTLCARIYIFEGLLYDGI